MDPIETVQRIEEDFAEQSGPFEDVEFPEERLLDEVYHDEYNPSSEERLVFISMFGTFDYNRDANQLVDNIVELWDEKWWAFNPADAANNEDDLADELERIGFRYPNRDATAWSKNCQILLDKYHGRWHELLLDVGCDAPSLVERLNDDGFSCLKGDKIAPMYARIINDEVAPLDDMWQLEIPVDTHIHRLTEELTDAEMSNDDVRAWWGVIGEKADISRHVVDGALWHIGNKWDDWGEDYWEDVTA